MKSMKKIAVALAILTAVGGSSYYFVKKNKDKQALAAVANVREQKVTQGDVKIDLTVDGQVVLPVTYVDFEVAGKIKDILVKSGQQVKKGAVLANIVADGFEDNLKKSETAYKKANLSLISSNQNNALQLLAENQKLEELYQKYENAKSSISTQLLTEKQKLQDLEEQFKKIELEYLPMVEAPDAYTKTETDSKKIQYNKAKFDYENQMVKYQSVQNQMNLDIETAKRNYEVQKQRYDIISGNSDTILELSKASIEDAINNLNLAKENLNKTVLVAPENGRILYISKKVGDMFNPNATTSGANSTNHFMAILFSGSSSVKCNVSEVDIKNISLGEKVSVKIEAVGDEAIGGKVTEINSLPKVDANGVVTYEVTLELDSKDKAVLDGMTCMVNFIFKEKKNVLYVPRLAITTQNGKQYVEVKDSNGVLTKKEIQTGLSDGEKVEVISGIDKGDVIIVRGVKK